MGRRAEWRLIATRFPFRFGRARFLACRRAALSGLPFTQLRGRAPAFVGGWRQARRHGGRSVFRNCSVAFGLAVSVGRRCSCRLHSFPQLDKLFPQIPDLLLTNAFGCAILLLHPNRKVPAERQTESARERCNGFALRRDSENPSSCNLAGFFFASGYAPTFAQASSKTPQGALRWLAGGCAPRRQRPPWGRVRRGGGGDDGGRTTERAARGPYLIKGTE